MTYLIAKAMYNNQERGDEFSPTHFVMEIDVPIIRYLHMLLKETKKIKLSAGLISAHYHFGFGIWANYNNWLNDKTFNKDYVFYKGKNLPIECEEQVYLDAFQIEMYPDAAFRFISYGKYDDEMIHTCSFDLFQFQNKLGKHLLEALS
jgi:hypothetical protein